MVKLTQDVEAAYEVESTYSDPAGSTLSHFGLLDTFDPRSVERAITPVPSLGQSTDTSHAKGPLAVSVPIKVACQGDGWQKLLGHSIGRTYASGSNLGTPMKLSNTADSMAVLAKEGTDYTLVTGVVPNEVTLTADYTTGGYITVEANCTGFYSQDATEANANFSNDGKLLIDDYSGVTWPTAPTTDPLLPTDLTVTYGGTQDDDMLRLNIADGKYVEVGERYLRVYTSAEALDGTLAASGVNSVPYDGVLDLTHADADTITDVITRINATGLSSDSAAGSGSGGDASVNLLKGIYRMTGALKNIPGIASTSTISGQDVDEGDMSLFTNLKTVSLKVANNNTPIPGKVTRGDGSPDVTEWLANKAISRGKADITLDLTMTAEDETLYDMYVAGTVIPLIRLDFGTSGSIALTNGTITSFSRPLSPGGEIVDTLSIKFRGSGDYKNYSSYAISCDWTI